MRNNNISYENDNISNVDVLLVIDIQKEFKDSYGQYEKVIQFIKEHNHNYDYVIGTFFKNRPDSMYVKHLGYTDCMYQVCDTNNEDLSKTAHPKPDYICDRFIAKNGYSINVFDIHAAIRYIAEERKESDVLCPHFDIVGCDADACVLATAFSLWDCGDDFRILSDYIYTTSKDFSKEDVLKIMRRNFGDCVV